MTRVRVGLFLLLMSLPLVFAVAQAPAPAPGAQRPGGPPPRVEAVPGKPAEEVYHNIQALKGLPSEDVLPSMQVFRSALGVECGFCHADVNGRLDLEADTKEEKATARKMIAMVKAINDQNFNGRGDVTCATCHQGHNNPSPMAPVPDIDALRARIAVRQAALAAGQPPAPPAGQPAAPAGPPGPPRRPPPPPVAPIFDKFIQAIGGQEAVDKLTTRVAKATVSGLAGQSINTESYQKAPNKAVSIQGQGSSGYDGQHAWFLRGGEAREVTGRDAETLAAVAMFFRDLNPKQAYPQAVVGGRDRINGHDCWVVRARVPNTRAQDRLYYDVDSGLLLRRITTMPTPFGLLPQTTDYDDYKEFNGVKVATIIRRYDVNNVLTTKLTEVSFNTPVDDAKFAMPATSAAPRQ